MGLPNSPEPLDPSKGWKLHQALERTGDPDLWQTFYDADKAWRDIGAPTRFTYRRFDWNGIDAEESNRRTREQRNLYSACSTATQHLEHDLRSHLSNQKLTSWGRPGSPIVAVQPIPASAWRILKVIDWENSIVEEGTSKKERIFDVLVYPVLYAANAPELLSEHSLADVFRGCVLEDREFVVLSKSALRIAPELERVFVQGQYPLRGIDKWPMAFEDQEIIEVLHSDTEKRGESAPREPLPTEVVVAANVLQNRYAALISLIRRGQLVAEGIAAMDRHPTTIPTSVWSHPNFYFDINGDVFQLNENQADLADNCLTRRWIGVVLRRPLEFHGKPLKHDDLRSSPTVPRSRGVTARQESIGSAIKALWPDGIPAGLPLKTRDNEIIAWQKLNKLAEVNPRTIKRYLSKLRKSGDD